MTARSYHRGHEIIYFNHEWHYSDNLEPAGNERPCIRCKKKPTTEGHDHCLGKIENVKFACCGHGIEKPYIIKK